MQVRTQLAVVGLIAVGWGAGTATSVRPVMAEGQRVDRRDRAALENAVARDPDNVTAARSLSALYLENRMWSLVAQTVGRMTSAVQRDPRVVLHVARAQEELGEVQQAAAAVQGALTRCRQSPPELAEPLGCDARTQTELVIEGDALDRMISWGLTPQTDPSRAALAHQMAVRPIRLAMPR